MAKHFRWLPAFPQALPEFPWSDGFIWLPGYCVPRFDITMGTQARELLWSARPWLGRFRLLNTYVATLPGYVLQTFGYLAGTTGNLGLRIWYDHAFHTIATVQQQNTSGNVWIYRAIDEDFSEIALPYGAGDTWSYEGEGFYAILPPYRYPRPPKLGRWNMTRIEGAPVWRDQLGGGVSYRLGVEFEFHHMNGCFAGFDEDWEEVTPGTGYPLVPEITPAQESEVIVALEGEGFNFDPDLLFFDYGSVA